MRKQLLVSAFAIAMMVATQAQAQDGGEKMGITLEPYVGFNLLGSQSGTPAPADNSVSGLGFGARATYGMDQFFGGIDFRMSMLTHTVEASSFETDLTNMQLGLVVGGTFDMLNVWGGLNFINKYTTDTDAYFKGMGFKFGLGYKVHEMVAVNAEYMLNPIGSSCSATDVCVDTADGTSSSFNTLFLSVSAPISL